jgi:3-phenylpropionate/trans-cinnamate dioxygenase ferredoxin subunit
MTADFVNVATTADIVDGEMIAVKAGDKEVLLAKIGGEYFAIHNVCSHFRALLTDGELHPEACEVQCPLHDSCFDLRTGVPKDLPADEPVAVYAVKVEGDAILVSTGA